MQYCSKILNQTTKQKQKRVLKNMFDTNEEYSRVKAYCIRPTHIIAVLVHTSACVHRDTKEKFGEHERCVRVTRGVAESKSSFVSATQTSLVLHISTNARLTHEQLFYNIFNPMENFFFSRDMFADVMSVHNRNMKHARAIEFDYTNLLAML